jgi:hypothetical protein
MRSGKCVAWHADDARADEAKRAAQLDGSAASYSGGRWRLAVSIVALLAALLLALGHAGAAAASACPSSWKTVEHDGKPSNMKKGASPAPALTPPRAAMSWKFPKV